jgi:endo-1,4-beta-mannosidase
VSPAPTAPTDARRFELGINYWPRGAAMAMWQELDRGAVREELAHIRDLGFSAVRFFALARDFLPAPLAVEPRCVASLVEVARAAAEAGLGSVPTLVTINMSGRMWWPAWMLDRDGRPRDLFADPLLLRSQALLVAEIAGALRGARSIRALDLANEIDDALRPGGHHAAWLWCALLAGTVRRAAPSVPVVLGLHQASLADANQVRVDDIAALVDEDVMHAYPLYSPVARSPLDPELVPFCLALTADLAGTGRAPLMQEFGICTAPPGQPGHFIVDDFLGRPSEQYLASEEEAAAYHEQVLERLWSMGAAGP